jgi:anti-anti-sigma factor
MGRNAAKPGGALASQDMAGSDGPAETSTAKIETTGSDGRHVSIALHGDIDEEVAPALLAELQRHLDAGRYFIRIDAAGVTFPDSSAIGALVTGAQRCVGMLGALSLINVPTGVRRTMRSPAWKGPYSETRPLISRRGTD